MARRWRVSRWLVIECFGFGRDPPRVFGRIRPRTAVRYVVQISQPQPGRHPALKPGHSFACFSLAPQRDLADRPRLLLKQFADFVIGEVEMVAQYQSPELVVGDGLAQRVEEVVPVRTRRQVYFDHLRRGVPLFPRSTPGLALQQACHLVAEDLAHIGSGVVRHFEGRDLSLHPEQALLCHLFGQVGLVDQHPMGFGSNEAVDRAQ